MAHTQKKDAVHDVENQELVPPPTARSTRFFRLVFVLLLFVCTLQLLSSEMFFEKPFLSSIRSHYPLQIHPLSSIQNETMNASFSYINVKPSFFKSTGNASSFPWEEYECVSWRQTNGCSPYNERKPTKDASCSTSIHDQNAGYCEIKHKQTGEMMQVMPIYCDSFREGVTFTCNSFQELMQYGDHALQYTHDTNFSFENNQQALLAELLIQNPEHEAINNANATSFWQRGIVIVVYEAILPSVYASLRSLKQLGCTLPIEMWYIPSEVSVTHPLIQNMTTEMGVYTREINDTRAVKFKAKLHAVFYSAFDQILFLDADNFVARDPTYLFDVPEFITTGAIFWPDFWHPKNTLFNIHERSFVWTVLGMEYVDMLEQESGQLLIDRRRHLPALHVLMYYGFHQPHWLDDLLLVHGDKDLFRFAWMKTDSAFHYIAHPAGSAGTKHKRLDVFCGLTMVQHDPQGKVLFLHRNAQKLTSDNRRKVWTHIQQLKEGTPLEKYTMQATGWLTGLSEFRSCFAKGTRYLADYTLKPMAAFGLEHLEGQLLEYATEADTIMVKKEVIDDE